MYHSLITSCTHLFSIPLHTALSTEPRHCIPLLVQELKCPARSMESNPNSWPWFYRMNDAMVGRFASCAPILTPLVEEGDEEFEPSPLPRKRARRTPGKGGMSEFLTESEMLCSFPRLSRCSWDPHLINFGRTSSTFQILTSSALRSSASLRAAASTSCSRFRDDIVATACRILASPPCSSLN